MNDLAPEHITTVARGISEYGILAIVSAAFVLLAIAVFFMFLRAYTKQQETLNTQFRETLDSIIEMLRKMNDMMSDVAEALRPMTLLQAKTLSSLAFDHAIDKTCRIIKQVRQENNVANHEATAVKIRTMLTNMHENRNSRFDCFTYRGRPLSSYSNPEWVEQVAAVVEGEIYNEKGENNGRAYTNVTAVYENIKLDFYHRLNS